MEPVHIHLALSHAPLFIVAVAFVALILAVFWNREALTRFGLVLVVLSALVAIPIFLTGEPAEEIAEGMVGVSEAAIERHEDAAGIGFLVLGSLAGLSLVTLLVFRRRTIPRSVPVVASALALAAFLALGYVASLGGQIRHTEIAGDAGRATGIEQTTERSRPDRDDDD